MIEIGACPVNYLQRTEWKVWTCEQRWDSDVNLKSNDVDTRNHIEFEFQALHQTNEWQGYLTSAPVPSAFGKSNVSSNKYTYIKSKHLYWKA